MSAPVLGVRQWSWSPHGLLFGDPSQVSLCTEIPWPDGGHWCGSLLSLLKRGYAREWAVGKRGWAASCALVGALSG